MIDDRIKFKTSEGRLDPWAIRRAIGAGGRRGKWQVPKSALVVGLLVVGLMGVVW